MDSGIAKTIPKTFPGYDFDDVLVASTRVTDWEPGDRQGTRTKDSDQD